MFPSRLCPKPTTTSQNSHLCQPWMSWWLARWDFFFKRVLHDWPLQRLRRGLRRRTRWTRGGGKWSSLVGLKECWWGETFWRKLIAFWWSGVFWTSGVRCCSSVWPGSLGRWEYGRAVKTLLIKTNLDTKWRKKISGSDGDHSLQHHHRPVRLVHVSHLNQWTNRCWRCLLYDLQVFRKSFKKKKFTANFNDWLQGSWSSYWWIYWDHVHCE